MSTFTSLLANRVSQMLSKTLKSQSMTLTCSLELTAEQINPKPLVAYFCEFTSNGFHWESKIVHMISQCRLMPIWYLSRKTVLLLKLLAWKKTNNWITFCFSKRFQKLNPPMDSAGLLNAIVSGCYCVNCCNFNGPWAAIVTSLPLKKKR